MRLLTIALLTLLTLAGGGVPMADAAEGLQAAREPIYETDGQGMQRVSQALYRARKDNKRVLLKIGGNWCGWCYKLHDTLHNEPNVHALLRNEYVLVMIDNQADIAVIQHWKIQPQGYPYLAVLDSSGRKLTEQETGSLEIGAVHDPERVLAFLNKWKPQPLDANEVLRSALVQAAKQNKYLFVHFGAPTCGWCGRLEALLEREDVRNLMSRDYVDLKIDLARMVKGPEVQKRISPQHSGGIPWFAILDRKGKPLITSDGPRGNIGYPVSREEISHFLTMIRKTARALTPEQIASIETIMTDVADEIKKEAGK